ncbi:hypothetical protein C8J57DRAFT_1679633 [Mycena rebaudengoi]|nr:hypothetical protein C8J57DRAFT_1679633 [Mycena rebaudengoi]
MPSNSVAGPTLPLDVSFDFLAWCETPADVPAPPAMKLTLKNARNVITERHNDASVTKTIDYELALTGGTLAANADVGPALKALYAYTDEEKELMAADAAFAAKVGPLPTYILELIAAKKAETARLEADERKARELERLEKDAEKKKLASLAPQAGSLVIKNPRSITSLSSSLVEAPSAFQSSLLHRVIPPLHFFTTERIKEVVDFPQKLIKETLTLEALPGKKPATVQVIDLAKMTKTWGGRGFVHISAKNVPGAPYQHTYAEEYEQHIYFFRHIDHFEKLYPVWRSEEIELRRRIFAGDAL